MHPLPLPAQSLLGSNPQPRSTASEACLPSPRAWLCSLPLHKMRYKGQSVKRQTALPFPHVIYSRPLVNQPPLLPRHAHCNLTGILLKRTRPACSQPPSSCSQPSACIIYLNTDLVGYASIIEAVPHSLLVSRGGPAA